MNADLNALTERVIGCVYAVSNGLGAGFLESVYENALALELAAAGISFQRQKPLRVHYFGLLVNFGTPKAQIKRMVHQL